MAGGLQTVEAKQAHHIRRYPGIQRRFGTAPAIVRKRRPAGIRPGRAAAAPPENPHQSGGRRFWWFRLFFRLRVVLDGLVYAQNGPIRREKENKRIRLRKRAAISKNCTCCCFNPRGAYMPRRWGKNGNRDQATQHPRERTRPLLRGIEEAAHFKPTQRPSGIVAEAERRSAAAPQATRRPRAVPS